MFPFEEVLNNLKPSSSNGRAGSVRSPSNGDASLSGRGRPGTRSSRKIKELVDRAVALGLADESVTPLRQIHRRLQQDPFAVGEPVYRLPTLQLQVRLVLLQPLSVTFAVHEEKPLVFIKVVDLLSGPEG